MKKAIALSALFLSSLSVYCQNADSLDAMSQVDSLIHISRMLAGKSDFDKALEVNAAAEKLALEKFGRESAAYGSTCFNHGWVLDYKGDNPEAEKWHLESKTIREKAMGKEHPDYAGSLVSLAILYAKMGNYEKSESFFLESITIYEKVVGKEHADYAMTLNNLAILYYIIGDYEKVEPLHLESVTIYEKTVGREHPDYAMSLNNLASLYSGMGNFEKAEPLYIESKTIYEKVVGREHPDYAASLHNLAFLYMSIGDYEKAEPLFIESKSIREKVMDKGHPDYAMNLNNLAILYSRMGSYEKAEPFFIQSKSIREKILGREHPEYAGSLASLATLYLDMGNYVKAEPLFIESKSILEKVLGKEHPDYAQCLHNLAVLYRIMGNYEKAESFFLESITIYEKVVGKEHPDYAMSLNSLAILYWDMDNYEKARALFPELNAICKKTVGKEHPNHAAYLNNLAVLYWAIKKFDTAESFLSQIPELDKSLLVKASRYLSERELTLYIQKFANRGNVLLSFVQIKAEQCAFCYDNALFHKGFLLNAVSQVSKLASDDSTTAEKYYRFKSYHRRLANEYSVPLAERDSATVADLEEKANTLEKELARTVAGFGEALRQVNWQEVQAALRPDEAAVEFVRYDFFNPKPTDSVMYAALIVRSGWQSPAWVTLGEEKELSNLFFAKENTFGNNINQLYAMRGIEPDSTQRSLEGLYPFIWRPLDSLLQGAKTVYFSPSGLLHYINHSAIPVDSGHNLDDRHHLVQLGSTRQLVVSSFTRRSPGEGESKSSGMAAAPTFAGATADKTATLFGGVRYDMDITSILEANAHLPQSETVASRGSLNFQNADTTLRVGNWQYLPGTELEINELEKTLHKTDATVSLYKGYAATEESFKRIGQATPSPRVLHIATHGFFFPDPKDNPQSAIRNPQSDDPVFKISDHPMIRSGLLLAGANHAWQTGKPLRPDMEDGILTAYEISQMNLSNTELVVLSACETGLGQIQGNEGVYGLQRAFKIAGAKYLIMSLWQVPDKQTSLLMTTFYKKWLEEKMEIPEAFRAAQKAMREQGFDPYQWAGFVLVE